uniref:GRAM domain-containing protein n=1 Tax=Hucho hucho TaxID=62062 RepID=A0A4W5PWD6_9TELE
GIIAFTRIHLVSLSCEDTQPWFVFPRLVSSSVHPPSGVLNEIDQYYIASLWYSKSYGVFFPFPVYSCALLRDILLQGRLYISRNWLCFYANLFGKDIKYVFVSLLSRDSVYDVLRRICTHLQVNGKKSLSLKQYLEEPGSLSMVSPATTNTTLLYTTLDFTTLLYSTLLYYSLLYTTLLHSTLHYTTLLYSTLIYFSLLYTTLFYTTIVYSTLLYSTLLYSTRHYTTLLYSTLLYSTLLYSTLLYTTIL